MSSKHVDASWTTPDGKTIDLLDGAIAAAELDAHANVSRKAAGYRRDCAKCRGLGTLRRADDTGYDECPACHGRGYTWTRTDERPDGVRKDRMG